MIRDIDIHILLRIGENDHLLDIVRMLREDLLPRCGDSVYPAQMQAAVRFIDIEKDPAVGDLAGYELGSPVVDIGDLDPSGPSLQVQARHLDLHGPVAGRLDRKGLFPRLIYGQGLSMHGGGHPGYGEERFRVDHIDWEPALPGRLGLHLKIRGDKENGQEEKQHQQSYDHSPLQAEPLPAIDRIGRQCLYRHTVGLLTAGPEDLFQNGRRLIHIE